MLKARFTDYRRVKGDPLGVQNNHESKSPTVGRSNKISQSSFGIVPQPIFLATKKGYSENEKWYFSQKNHFLFSGHVKKMSLSQFAKNEPKTQF